MLFTNERVMKDRCRYWACHSSAAVQADRGFLKKGWIQLYINIYFLLSFYICNVYNIYIYI